MKKRKIKCYHWKNLPNLIKINDVIVNCTSVGYLNHDKSPIPQKIIKSLKKKNYFMTLFINHWKLTLSLSKK